MDGEKRDEERPTLKRRAMESFPSEPMPRRSRGSSINELLSPATARQPPPLGPNDYSRETTSHAGLMDRNRETELLLLKESLEKASADLEQLVRRRQQNLLRSQREERTTQLYFDQLDALRASPREGLRPMVPHGDIRRRSADPMDSFDYQHVPLREAELLRIDQTSQRSRSLQDNINNGVFDGDIRRGANPSSFLWQPRIPSDSPRNERLLGLASIGGSELDFSLLPADDLRQFDPLRSTFPRREQLISENRGSRQGAYLDSVAASQIADDRLAARNESLEELLVEERRRARTRLMTERRQFQPSLLNDFPPSDSSDLLPQIDNGTNRRLQQSSLSETANASTAHARLKALISNVDNDALQKLVEDCSREVVEASNDSASRNDRKVAAKRRAGGIPLAAPSDKNHLTKYQVCVRESLEFFEATSEDVATTVQGRKKKIRLGQVGVRCRFCAHLPLKQRRTGAVHYSNALKYIYQASQNIAAVHFGTRKDGRYIDSCCPCVPDHVKQMLDEERLVREESLIGKTYWIKTCTDLGIYEHDGALWLRGHDKAPDETDPVERSL